MASIFQRICSEVAWCRQDVLEATLDLAIEIGREGREGRRVRPRIRALRGLTDEPVVSRSSESVTVCPSNAWGKLRTGSRSGSALNFSHSSARTPELPGYGDKA
jgi:hypothetical protein